jgi:hypothetical protein
MADMKLVTWIINRCRDIKGIFLGHSDLPFFLVCYWLLDTKSPSLHPRGEGHAVPP